MSRAMDGHDWRDPGFPGSYMPVQELSPAERQAALKAREERDKKDTEALRESLAAPVVAEKVMGEHIDVAVARASVIETPAEKRNRQLGLVEVNGKLLHKSEARRRAELREEDAEGVTPEQREFMERYLAEEDEPEEDIWHDTEDE
jgi:hypothetical protein